MKVKVSTKTYDMCHVYFHCLPIGAMFLHQGEFYTKDASDNARKWTAARWGYHEVEENHLNEFRFDGHEGCIISQEQFKIFNIQKESIRRLR